MSGANDQSVVGMTRGLAAVRAAEALLRTLGGGTIAVRVPLNTVNAGNSGELGLAGAATEDVALSPVVVRRGSRQQQEKAGRGRVEVMISAASLASARQIQDAAASEAFFDSALGIVHNGILKRIESFAVDEFGGVPYMYRLIVRE